VVLSLLFETWEHWVHHRIHKTRDKNAEKILAAVFKELTCLGFIGLTLFSATRCGLVGWCANHFGETDEHVLLETFETVHVIIFLLLIVLIFQAVAMLHVSRNVVQDWSAYEHMRAFGKYRTSLESMFVTAGYLERVPNASAPRGTDLACLRSFSDSGTFMARLRKRGDNLRSLVAWRSLRHEFLFPSSLGKSKVPNPAMFSYSAYLRCCMTGVVLSLVELDKRVWCMTLLLPWPVMCFQRSLTLDSWMLGLCFFAWGLFFAAVLLSLALEEDLRGLMPAHSLPEDPRQILLFFQGTSTSEMLQDIISHSGAMDGAPMSPQERAIKRGAPGFRSMRPFCPAPRAPKRFILSQKSYEELLRILGFWQAISITALCTTVLAHRPQHLFQAVICVLTLAEWPLMLFYAVPLLIQRLTMLVANKVDENLIRSITLDGKEALLRHQLRLVQFEGFYESAWKTALPWALDKSDKRSRNWSAVDANRSFKKGQRTFQSLPASARDEVGSMFAFMDLNNNGDVGVPELAKFLANVGFHQEKSTATAEALVRLVDSDGTGALSEERFQAVVALATVARPKSELKEDVGTLFDMVDKEKSGKVHMHQITQRLQDSKFGEYLRDEDLASLLYDHFSQAKPVLTKEDLVSWFGAMGSHWHPHEHEHGHSSSHC